MTGNQAAGTEAVRFSTRKYIFVLIGLVLLIMSVITITIYWQLNKSNRIEITADEYHLSTMLKCSQIQKELNRIKMYFHEIVEHNSIWEYESRDTINLNTSLLIIKEEFTAIEELQQRYAYREYENVLNNADNILSRILTIHSEIELKEDIKDISETLTQLSIFLEQLRRLHANTYNEVMSALIVERPKAFRNTLLFLSIPVIIGILLIKKILNLIRSAESEIERHRLHLQKMVEERTRELFESNENLMKEIIQRTQAEEKIRESLKEKEVLMKEIHHRVKNNMTVMYSLLNLQAKKVEDKYYSGMLNDCMNRIKTMASIHEKLYQSEDLSKIVFSDYIKNLADNIIKSFGLSSRIKLITDIETTTLGINASIPCGLIVNELITNAVKYAFPEDREGEITVSLHSNDKDEIELTIKDNGIGIPEGLDIGNTDSLGLNLINALVKQLQGKIELNKEKGTCFHITFNKS